MVTKRCKIKDGVIYIDKDLIEEKRKADEMIYLSDFLDDIPSQCVFLKGVTGCGATTLALQAGTYNRIVALPTQNTVRSKWVKRDPKTHDIIDYDNSLLCIYGGFNDTLPDLKRYIDRCTIDGSPIKIVCTYDQVEKLVMRLKGLRRATKKEMSETGQKWVQDNSQDALCIDVPEMRLFIDEIHQVLDDYKTPDRRESIKGMLDCIKYFPNTVCITATPLEEKYFFDEIKNLPIIKVHYPIAEKHKIQLRQCQKLSNETLNVVMDHLENRAFGNAHIFINSVSFICKLLKKINLSKFGSDIRVVCGDTEYNKDKIREAIDKAFGKDFSGIEGNVAEAVDKVVVETLKQYKTLREVPVSSINSPVRKINFYTRTAWLGADVFDPQAQIYIISDGANFHTMADISTAYIQIVGRVRNSNNLRIIHLYKENRYIGIEDIKGRSTFDIEKEERSKNRADFFEWYLKNRDLAMAISQEKREAMCYLVIDKITGEPIYDKYLEWNDEISNKVIRGDYASLANISAALYDKGGFDVEIDNKTLTEQIKKNPQKRKTFESVFTEYVNLRENRNPSLFPFWENSKQVLEISEPLVKSAYEVLGVDKVKALGYKKREVQRAVDLEMDARKRKLTFRELGLKIKVGKTYTNAELKAICQYVKEKLALNDTIRLSDYFETEATSVRVNGEVTNAKRIKKKNLIK